MLNFMKKWYMPLVMILPFYLAILEGTILTIFCAEICIVLGILVNRGDILINDYQRLLKDSMDLCSKSIQDHSDCVDNNKSLLKLNKEAIEVTTMLNDSNDYLQARVNQLNGAGKTPCPK